MPRIRTDNLLARLASGNGVVKLKGLQGGSFCMLLECFDGAFIHENNDGTMKEYPDIDNALIWLKRRPRQNKSSLILSFGGRTTCRKQYPYSPFKNQRSRCGAQAIILKPKTGLTPVHWKATGQEQTYLRSR
jgi:hypothetical protein